MKIFPLGRPPIECVLLLLLAATANAATTVTQPRSFGYVVGDIVTQRVLLDNFTPDSLPAPGPLGNWVERHAVRIERDTRGRQWLAVEYQIMNSPQMLHAVALPAWRLKAKNSNAELLVPEWQISIGPLTPEQAFAQGGLGALRPDRNASPIDIAPMQRWIRIWVAAAVALLLAWVGWFVWRNWQASSSRPFAKALRELRGVDEQSPEAWYSLHRAFDATAGRVVQRETLPLLFERAPQFLPQRAAIEGFLEASMTRFFGVRSRAMETQPAPHEAVTPDDGVARREHPAPPAPAVRAPAAPAPPAPLSLRALCADLRRIEKRSET